MNTWSDKAVEAAWLSLRSSGSPLEKSDVRSALNEAVKAQEKETKQIMNERLRQKIEELECRKD